MGTEDDPLSRRGLHRQCAHDRLVANLEQLHDRSGPEWERYLESWRAGQVRYAERVISAQGSPLGSTPDAPIID